MLYTGSGLTTDQLEVMIAAIRMEFGPKNDDQLSVLIAANYKLNAEDVVTTLQAYRTTKDEDYEGISEKCIMYGEY